jgi:hypothetical protein
VKSYKQIVGKVLKAEKRETFTSMIYCLHNVQFKYTGIALKIYMEVHNMKRFITGVLLLVLIVTTMIFPAVVNGAEDVSFSISKSTATGTDQQLVISLQGDNLKDLYAYEAVLSFNPDELELVKAVSELQGFSVPPKIEGDKIYIAFTKVGKVMGVNGSIKLSTITFRGKTPGDAVLKLETVKTVDSNLISKTYTIGTAISASMKESIHQQDVVLGSDKKSATSNLTLEVLNNLLANAQTDVSGVKTVDIEIKMIPGVSEYIQKLPASALTSAKVDKLINIRTPFGNVRIPGNMLDTATLNGSSDVSIIIKKEDNSKLSNALKQQIGNRPVIGLYVKTGDKLLAWNKPDASVFVSLPYTPTADEAKALEHIVIIYIDDKLNAVSVPTGNYNQAARSITFRTNHFSMYAVQSVSKSFSDLAKYAWAKQQIEVLASKGIINGVSEKNYGPVQNITRADFVSLLVRSLGLTAKVDSNYSDIKTKDYFYNTVGIAKKLGITTITGNNFKPQDMITRQDVMVFTAAALKYAGKVKVPGKASDLKKFNDNATVSPTAVEGVATVVNAGIITGSNNQLNPLGKLTRAEAAIVIYKLYNMLVNE